MGQSGHDANFFVSGGYGGCYQWRQSWHFDNSQLSGVLPAKKGTLILLFPELYHVFFFSGKRDYYLNHANVLTCKYVIFVLHGYAQTLILHQNNVGECSVGITLKSLENGIFLTKH